jgi:hypothetical protein
MNNPQALSQPYVLEDIGIFCTTPLVGIGRNYAFWPQMTSFWRYISGRVRELVFIISC